MAVYVDALRTCVPNAKWKYKQSCHMVADTEDELHRFASRLMLRREWFQDHSLPHYDLTSGRRRLAVELGAVSVTDIRETVELFRRLRKPASPPQESAGERSGG